MHQAQREKSPLFLGSLGLLVSDFTTPCPGHKARYPSFLQPNKIQTLYLHNEA